MVVSCLSLSKILPLVVQKRGGNKNIMFKTYLPQVMTAFSPMKGIALAQPFEEDVTSLGCLWYYNWSSKGNNLLGFVPMSWGGGLIPQTEGYVLFLNEPESKSQSNKTPEQAIELLKILKGARPNLKIIAGGCGAIIGATWMTKFRDLVIQNNLKISGYHFHGYIESWITLDKIRNYWTFIKDNFYDGGNNELWCSEFADTQGTQLADMVNVIKELEFDRYAYFTNRVLGNEGDNAYPSNWPKPEKISLIGIDGSLSFRGDDYGSY